MLSINQGIVFSLIGGFMVRLSKCFSQEKVTQLFGFIKDNILEQALLNLSGKEKKANVDNAVKAFITQNFVSKNVVLSFLIKVLIDIVPRVTQSVYDILMTYKAGDSE